jgi:hypothetical protein
VEEGHVGLTRVHERKLAHEFDRHTYTFLGIPYCFGTMRRSLAQRDELETTRLCVSRLNFHIVCLGMMLEGGTRRNTKLKLRCRSGLMLAWFGSSEALDNVRESKGVEMKSKIERVRVHP